MTSHDDKPVVGPLALPKGFDLNPDQDESSDGFLGAAWRTENPIGSYTNSFQFDHSIPFDPEYRPVDDVMGTKYEQYGERFFGARNRQQVGLMKAQIDREIEDRRSIDAAGWWGTLAEIGAGVLSPTSFLPGGAVVKGVKGGIRIGRTSMSVAIASGAAIAMDEIALQGSQETRTLEESAYAIGGGVILGGMLGGLAGSMSRNAYMRSSATAEVLPEQLYDFDTGLKSLSAAQNPQDYSIRRAAFFETLNKVPVFRGLVRTDPMLRNMLSDFDSVRKTGAELYDTVLQRSMNELGFDASAGGPVEAVIKRRMNTELVQIKSYGGRQYAEYVHDGPVGMIGRVSAPVTAKFQHLMSKKGKMPVTEFYEEVGSAMLSNDIHPIPQVAKVAAEYRKFFEGVKKDAIELGIFDEGLQLKNGDNYFMRSYNVELIRAHAMDGSDKDIYKMLTGQFEGNRVAAKDRLINDRTHDQSEAEVFKLREQARGAESAFRKAKKKAKGKQDRAEATIKRETAVSRVTGALRKAFKDRSENLNKGVLEGDELSSFKDMIKDVRGLKNLEPTSLLAQIRELGGIKDPRPKNVWRNKDWVNDGMATELEDVLGASAKTIRRNDGWDMDTMREALEELGYLPEGSSINDLMDAITREAAGEKIYSQADMDDLAHFQSVSEFAEELERLGVDVTKPVEKIIQAMPGMSRSQKVTKAKAGEAGRSAVKAGRAETSALDGRLMKAMDRLEDAKARRIELDEIVGPKVKAELDGIKPKLVQALKSRKNAKAAKSADEFYAAKSDEDIKANVQSTVNSILGMKPGEHSFGMSMSDVTRARVLDVDDEILAPWLNMDAEEIMGQYFHSFIPELEMVRKFGDVNMTDAMQEILKEKDRLVANAKTMKERKRLQVEFEERVKELYAMRDRIAGRYGIPNDPNSAWVRGSRIARSLSYTGFLGGMTVSAMPDVAGVIGRNGLEAAFGPITLMTDPKRLGMAMKDVMELGGAAEWFLNGRAMAFAELTDRHGAKTMVERVIDEGTRLFGYATGMVPWNVFWKTLGGAVSASKMSKAAMRLKQGKATKKDLIKLSENYIDRTMALRIADQLDAHADMDGHMWLPRGQDWADKEAFDAFATAMNREMDLMIITPGQDKPLSFSTETGKFFSQFKSFTASAHHRILLSGIQRADGDVLGSVVMFIALGMLVSRTKSYQFGHEPKEGIALWEDAIDRSGIAGWLMEGHSLANGLAGGRLSISGEEVSRYGTRSRTKGLLGPSVGMVEGVYEAIGAMSRGKMTARDTRNLNRPLPGNNLPYLIDLFDKIGEVTREMVND